MSVSRKEKLLQWLAGYFAEPVTVTLISGDASFRQYYRLSHQQNSFIVMDTPVALIATEPFALVAAAYQAQGIKVPAILAIEPALGFMLLEDLGDTSLLSCLTDANVESWYQEALALLPDIANVKRTAAGDLPQFDAAFVHRELSIFSEWLLSTHLQFTLSETQQTVLAQAFDYLTANALAQPQVGMHRDFHSRNLMVVQDELYVIDFQDAVIGPITYDAVSLLRDCYVRWPDAVVDTLRQQHFETCQQQGLLADTISVEQYIQWFDLMGIQRHLKAAGIFARLNHRDNKPGYLKDIPLTLTYVIDIASRYPELQALAMLVKDVHELVLQQESS
ncbi:MAG: aminoglycoside phosphotransferase family protein [Shewanella sp.]